MIGDPQEYGEAEEEAQEDEHPPAAGVDFALGLQFDQVHGRDALAFPDQHLAPLHLEVDGLQFLQAGLLAFMGFGPVGGDVGNQQELGHVAHQPPVGGRHLHGHVPAISCRRFPPLFQLNKCEGRALHRLLT